MSRKLLVSLGLCLLIGACVAGGAKQFRAGEKAHDQGDLDAAEAAYKSALDAEPGNPQYKTALEKVRSELSSKHESDAKAREKAGDWKGASDAWARAAAANPGDTDLKARAALSKAKAEDLGPDEWFERVKQIAAENPGSAIVEKSLAGAKAKACQHNIQLGEKFLETGEGGRALKHFDRAKEIDPSSPGLDSSKYNEAAAYALMEQGDAREAADDPLTAYELYQQAFEKKALPELKSKIAKVKSKTSAVLTKIEQARAFAAKNKWADAVRVYDSLAGSKGVPASVEAEAAKAREEVAKQEAEKSLAFSQKGDTVKAEKSLVEVTRLQALAAHTAAIKESIEEVDNGRPGKAMRALESTGLDDKDIVLRAARALASASAKKIFDKAKAMSKKDAAGALALIADLGPFEDSIPQIKELRRELRAGSFTEMLDEALKEAKAGNDEEASQLLLAALSASNAPDKLRDPVTDACDKLKKGDHVSAEVSFQQALSAEPRSKLAQRGIDIARLRKKDAELKALDVIKKGSGDEAKAVDTLARILAAEPSNPSARSGADVLLARLESNGKTLSDGQAAVLLGHASRLSEVPKNAADALDSGRTSLEKSDYSNAETSFAKVLETAPSLRVGKIGQQLARDRLMSSLKSGAKRAAEGDDSAAKTLAELLKKDPNDAEARAALQSILDKAAALSEAGRDADAAKQLELATIATSPAPGVKVHLDNGNKAIAASKMEDAEKAYSEALDLETDQPVAKLGHEIAKAARVNALTKAVDEAKKGGGGDQAREALRRTLEMDPNSAEARKAFNELIEEAKVQGAAGNDRSAGQLLDTANVVSKPENVRKAIGDANKLLGEGKHKEAEAAYAAVMSGGESKVAQVGKEIAHARLIAVLTASAAELKNGGDLERGAKAVAELRAVEPNSTAAKDAIDGAVEKAQTLAAGGDDKGAAKLLRAVAQAAGEARELTPGLMRYESGKLDDAIAELEKVDSDLARRSAAMIRQRKLGTLKAGLSGDDRAAAESIKALWKADPNSKDALAAFNKLLEKAKALSAKGDDRGAADALAAATIASQSPADLTETLNNAGTHLAEARYAQAEKSYLDAQGLSKDSKVAVTGVEIARKKRLVAEQAAIGALAKPGDPTPHARVLAASLLVDPQSKVVSTAFTSLHARARKAAAVPNDVETAQSLDSAAILENIGSEVQEKMIAADALFAKASFNEAELAYEALAKGGDEGGPAPSKTAAVGRELARLRRIGVLKTDLEAAKKDSDILRQSLAVQKILELDPKDKIAVDLSKKLKVSVVDSRVAAAKQQKELGKLGVAWLYLRRALDVEPGNAKAKAELDAIEALLKPRLDLVIKVDKVGRAPSAGEGCKGFEELLRNAVMDDGSKRSDLGGYILSKDWTAAVDRGDKNAPQLGGVLEVTISRCQNASSTGKTTLLWQLTVPPASGNTASKGVVEADLPTGMVPRDEQDGEGNNARRALSRRASKILLDKMNEEKAATDAWLLVLAEHAMKQKDVQLAADAYARMTLKRSTVDPTRVSLVEQFLDAELK